MSIKVIHVIGGLGVGGAEMALLNLVEGFRGSEVQCQVYALGTSGGMLGRFEQAGVSLRCFDFRRHPLKSAWDLYRTFQNEQPDVIQTWLYHADLIGGLLGRLAGCRAVIWGIHSIGLAKDAKFSTRLVRRACAVLSWLVPERILCVAEASRQAHAQVGYDLRRMVVQPNGYDFTRMVASPGAREGLRSGWEIPPGCRVVGTVGRYCHEKDYPNFIQAASAVSAADPNVRFLMVGRGLDACNHALVDAINRVGQADRFILAGERADVMDCLSAMDLFCLSSRMEAFPNVLVEAMATGLPCLSTAVGDAARIVSEWGTLVPKEDPGQLAAGMGRLLALSDADRVSLGARARAYVTSEFSVQSLCQLMGDLYRGLSGKGA